MRRLCICDLCSRFGISQWSQGEEISSPSAHKIRQNAVVSDDDEDLQIADLELELAELDLEVIITKCDSFLVTQFPVVT